MSTASPRAAIAVLISGSGTNLQALVDAVRGGAIAADIVAVISDRPDAYGLERARAAGIDARHMPLRRRTVKGYDAALLRDLRQINPDLIVLAGFMRILSPDVITAFAGRIINIHPSLLPRHRGLDTHRRVLAAGDSEHGATVHFVSAELDAGPLIIQYRLAVSATDTEQSLEARVHTGEYIILPRAVAWFAEGRLSVGPDGVMLDGKVLDGPVVVEEE